MDDSMKGKVAAVFGIANHRSIAFGISKALKEAGVQLALNYQNDRMGKSLDKLAGELGDPWRRECDVTDEGAVQGFFEALKEEFGGVDYLVHSVAFAKREELGGNFVDTSWDGYEMAQHVSAYSLVRLCRHATPLMEGRGGSVIALTYYGAEKVVPNYNVMGVAKAALEASVRYLASDLGPKGIRVNAVSAGPIRTLSASGVGGFTSMLDIVAERAPLRRNVTTEDVGKASRFLLSDEASGITGQILYVDAGVSIMGM